MRTLLILLIALVAGCATAPQLASAPPPGVDLSGHWRLNVADSDDPLRIPQSLSGGTPGAVPQRGRGNHNGGQSGQGPLLPPVPIPMSVVADMLRWPGSEVEVAQEGGVVTFNSDGDSRLYAPASGKAGPSRRGRRSVTPATCGWAGAGLVVRVDADEDQPGYEARYRLSDDGTRLLQVITLQGARLTGFTLSRVWDRQ